MEGEKQKVTGSESGGRQPTCYLLWVHVQLKLGCDERAVLLAGLPAVAAARPLPRRGAAQAHVAELDVFCEEEPAVCGDTHTHTCTTVDEIHRAHFAVCEEGEAESMMGCRCDNSL